MAGGVRFRPRLDTTQKEIKAALEAIGYKVISLAALGGEAPDLLVGGQGRTILIECKSPRARHKHGPRENARMERQARFREQWPGGPIFQVFSAEQAIAAVTM